LKIKALIPTIVLFSAIAILEMYGEQRFHGYGETFILYAFKPLLMPVLMLFLWINTRLNTRFDQLIFTGLFFGWIGDVLLMFNKNELFVFGLASFLICHICYILAFIHNIRKSSQHLSLINRFVLGLLPLFYLIVLYSYIYPFMVGSEINQPFLIPVSVYAVVIVTMSLFALWRIGSSNKISTALIILGAFTFMISDSLIALNKFVAPFEYAQIFIMITYCLAQLWITLGTIQHRRKPNQ
jgi:uncharacterized membrane protein YhhN